MFDTLRIKDYHLSNTNVQSKQDLCPKPPFVYSVQNIYFRSYNNKGQRTVNII